MAEIPNDVVVESGRNMIQLINTKVFAGIQKAGPCFSDKFNLMLHKVGFEVVVVLKIKVG